MFHRLFNGKKSGTLDFPERFVACDLKLGRYRQFTVLILNCVSSEGRVYFFNLTNMTIAKGHLSRNKSQMSNIRTIIWTIGPLVKIFSEILDQSKTNFMHVKYLYKGGINVFINNQGHMTKMDAMSIYRKNASILFFSRSAGPISTRLGM